LDEDDLEEPHDPATETLGDAFLRLWKKRELSIVGDFVIAAWALCVMPEVRKDCKERMTGKHRDAIDQVIEKMFSYDPNIDVDQKKDQFWTEFKAFQDTRPTPLTRRAGGTLSMSSRDAPTCGMRSTLILTLKLWEWLG